MTYQIMYYGGLITFLVFLAVAVFLFFYLRIDKTFGNLTGITAKKNIKRIRESGKQEYVKDGNPSGEIRVKHGKTTTKLVMEPAKVAPPPASETTLLTNFAVEQETTLLVQPTTNTGFRTVINVLIANSQERI